MYENINFFRKKISILTIRNSYHFYSTKAKRAIAEVLKHLNEVIADMQILEAEMTRVKNKLMEPANETIDEISIVENGDRGYPNFLEATLNRN